MPSRKEVAAVMTVAFFVALCGLWTSRYAIPSYEGPSMNALP